MRIANYDNELWQIMEDYFARMEAGGNGKHWHAADKLTDALISDTHARDARGRGYPPYSREEIHAAVVEWKREQKEK